MPSMVRSGGSEVGLPAADGGHGHPFRDREIAMLLEAPGSPNIDPERVGSSPRTALSAPAAGPSGASGGANGGKSKGPTQEERIRALYPMVPERTPLPVTWSQKDKWMLIGLSQGDLRVHYKGNGKGHKDAASVRACHPIPAACGVYYFEVKVISKGRDGYIAIGLSAQGVDMNSQPGWNPKSYGFHADDGHSFSSSGTGQPYGPTFSTGEVVEANFGQFPFVFDIQDLVQEVRHNVQFSVECFPVANVFPVTLRYVVAYHCQPFEEEVASIRHRQQIQKLVLNGMIAEAVELTESLYPTIFTRFPNLLFQLRIRQFIEMVAELRSSSAAGGGGSGSGSSAPSCRPSAAFTPVIVKASSSSTVPPPAGGMGEGQASNGVTPMDVEEAAPSCSSVNGVSNGDAPPPPYPDSASSSSSSSPSHDATMRMLAFGRELSELHRNMEPGAAEKNGRLLFDAFSILAYSAPGESPMAYLLDPAQRETVSAALNSAILETLGLPPKPPLEFALGHAFELIKAMSRLGYGACAFANVKDVLGITVLTYLIHHGYIAAAEAFARITGQPFEEEVASIRHRQQIQKLVLNGMIAEAVELTESLYPTIFTRFPNLLFQLRIRQFIEMVAELRSSSAAGGGGGSGSGSSAPSCRPSAAFTPVIVKASSSSTVPPPAGGMGEGQASNGVTPMDVEEAAPSCSSVNGVSNGDAPPPPYPDSASSSSSSSASPSHDATMRMLAFGRELSELHRNMEPGAAEKNGRLLFDAFSILAYSAPGESPMAYLLDPAQRETVSAALNSAILETLGLPPKPPLEFALGHAFELIKAMSRLGYGACAFANVKDVLGITVTDKT
ncbi:unnamed protein product [Cyprideis torosa]|uniref:Uncharacterized protein n=1 Tax=Cyprideis torosa TaxID=163714 RepID=A0A7R8WDP1_9CRUS|nr:unnamed protein product [Cyprideis torosa]CAG0892009.1 unnamed protein product [Cyprideis torosa]